MLDNPLDGIRSPFGPRKGSVTFAPFIPSGSTGLLTADTLTFKVRE